MKTIKEIKETIIEIKNQMMLLDSNKFLTEYQRFELRKYYEGKLQHYTNEQQEVCANRSIGNANTTHCQADA